MLRKNEEVQNGNGSGNGLGMGLLTRFRELRCFSNCMFVVFSFNDRLLKAGEGEGWTLKVEQISEKSVGGRAISRNGGFFESGESFKVIAHYVMLLDYLSLRSLKTGSQGQSDFVKVY